MLLGGFCCRAETFSQTSESESLSGGRRQAACHRSRKTRSRCIAEEVINRLLFFSLSVALEKKASLVSLAAPICLFAGEMILDVGHFLCRSTCSPAPPTWHRAASGLTTPGVCPQQRGLIAAGGRGGVGVGGINCLIIAGAPLRFRCTPAVSVRPSQQQLETGSRARALCFWVF